VNGLRPIRPQHLLGLAEGLWNSYQLCESREKYSNDPANALPAKQETAALVLRYPAAEPMYYPRQQFKRRPPNMWNGNVQVDSVTRNAQGQTIARLIPRVNGTSETPAFGELSITLGKTGAAAAIQPGAMYRFELIEESGLLRGKAASAGGKTSG
jgi:hypothetical protein